MSRFFTLFLFCHILLSAKAQEYSFKQYRVENGLPSDVIKGCAQDSLGYFWIATDDGLVRYDGIKFITYREALHSNFAKGFLTTRDHRLIAFGDLDVIEIQNLGDTVIFKSLCPVARNLNDSTLSYPKLLYEDSHDNIWVSESQSVVKLRGKSFKRYHFDLANRSPQFLRSFAFFEDRKGDLYISSFQGNIFRYNLAKDEFELQDEKFPKEVEYLSVIENRIIIGCYDGLFEVSLMENGGLGRPRQLLKTRYVSCLTRIYDNTWFLGTRGSTHFIADLTKNTFKAIPFAINNVNHVFTSSEKDIWVSGNDGLISMRENLFWLASENINNFIESIAEDPVTGKIYYTVNTTLYAFDRTAQKSSPVLSVPNGYFQALIFSSKGLWATNAFMVFLYAGGKIQKTFDFSKDGRFITDITSDVNGNIWLAEPGHNCAYMIDHNSRLWAFKVPLGTEGTVNMMCDGDDGVYIASTGKESYLFFKSYSDTAFHNISVPVNFVIHGDFNVTDLVITKDLIWLATSEGLLKFDRKKIERVNLGPAFSELAVKSITLYSENKLMLTNAYGLVLYDLTTGGLDLFNESSGLLSNTITPRGLFLSKDRSVWVGTSKGLCYSSRPLNQLRKTPLPQFIETRADGKHVHLDAEKEIDYGSFISILVSSITFPEKEVTVQYKLNPKEEWKNSSGPEISLSTLSPGNYTLEVRAKKNGPYSWSDTAVLKFQIAKPFWRRTWFLLLCFLAAMSLVAITVLWVNTWNNKRNQELQSLVAERTNELRVINEELAHRNNELDRFVYSASHDLSAPLKSLLGLITVAKMENPDSSMSNYLEMMRRSVLKLESFIRDIISYSRNTRLDVRKEPVDFKVLVQSIWHDLSFMPDADQIRFELISELQSPLLADETRLRIIFNNLLSNAIKFHQKEKDCFIKVTAEENQTHFRFTVEDNGIGISHQFREKIFDMFFRANETVQGSGLGLYILKETLTKLRGTIEVESKLGEGSKFIIYLPK